MPTGLGTEIQWYSPTVGGGAVNADDQSGNGNHGTFAQASAGGTQMAITAETGAGGTHAFDFNTANRAYVQAPSQVNNGMIGISFWANLTSVTSNKVLIVDCTNTSTGDGSGGLFVRTSGSKVQFFAGNGSWETNGFSSTATVPVNTWFHCVIQQNGTDTEIYIDGVASGVTTAGDNPWAADAGHAIAALGTDGRSGAGNQFTLERYMDDIRWHNRALTQDEITHIATSRGILGGPVSVEGIGDELLWYCPSLDDSFDDLSGNDNHGTAFNGLSTAANTDEGGVRAYDFNGTNHRIDTPSGLFDPASDNFTVGMWAKSDSFTGANQLMLSQNGTLGRSLMFRHGVSNSFRTFLGGSSTDISGVFAGQNGVWHHWAITYDGTKVRLYQNGVLGGSANRTGESTTGKLLIGSSKSATQFWNGMIDDIRVSMQVTSQGRCGPACRTVSQRRQPSRTSSRSLCYAGS